VINLVDGIDVSPPLGPWKVYSGHRERGVAPLSSMYRHVQTRLNRDGRGTRQQPCRSGFIRIAKLPTTIGWWRPGSPSVDVRRCSGRHRQRRWVARSVPADL